MRKDLDLDLFDRLLSRLFETHAKISSTTDPQKRFQVLNLVLNPFGGTNISAPAQVNQIEWARQLLPSATLEDIEGICRLSESCETVLASLLPANISYCALSYWSPIDERRHTLSRRMDSREHLDRRISTARAFAFYALSYIGARKMASLKSLVQYVIESDSHKRPVDVVYGKPIEGHCFLHLPEDLADRFLEHFQITQILDDCITNNESISNEDLEDLLTEMMENLFRIPPHDYGLGDTFFSNFSVQVAAMPDDLRSLCNRVATELSGYLETRKAITLDEAAFMVMTHYLYRMVCPADRVLMLTTKMQDSYSAMTVGGTGPWEIADMLLVKQVGKSLLQQPYLADTLYLESLRSAADTARLALGDVGHILETPLVTTKNSICEALRLLEGHDNHDELRKSLLGSRGDVERSLQLIFVSRHTLRRDYSVLKNGVCNLEQVFHQIKEEAFPFSKNVSISELQLDGAPNLVVGSKAAWTNVAWTLLHNATVHSTDGSEVCVELHFEEIAETRMRNSYAKLIVSNAPQRPPDARRMQHINEALQGSRDRIPHMAQDSVAIQEVRVREHGIGLGILGKFIQAINAKASASLAGSRFIITIGNIEICNE